MQDTPDREFSKHEKYSEETMRRLNTQVEDMVDDSGVGVEADE
jgi:hypothetical protein